MNKKQRPSTKAGPAPSPQAIQMLSALLTQGQLVQCEQQARAMTAQFADHAFGWSILGVCLAQMGRFSEALAPMQHAVSLQPSNVGLLNNLGNILNNLGRSSEAEQCFRRVLAQQPDSVEVLSSLAATLNAQERFSEAEACFRRVLALKPADVQALNSLGNVLCALGRSGEAETCYLTALALQPDMAVTYHNLGIVLKNMDRPREAEANFRRALVLQPDFMESRFFLGNVLYKMERLAEAEACFRRVLELKPDYAEAHGNLGLVLVAMDRPSEAETCFRRELAFKPNDAMALHNLGVALLALTRLSEAEACFRSAVALKPDYAHAHSKLGSTLSSLGRFEEAEACYQRTLELDPDDNYTRSNLLFSLTYRSGVAAEALHQARLFGQSVNRMASRRYTEWLCEAAPKRLRVGLVSGDLCQHVVSTFLENILREIDPERIELIAYPTWPNEDHVSQRLRAHLAAWRPIVGLTDEAAAARIRADGVHVLLDLSGHTRHSRLPVFAYKPAPVQATWLGYLATTGVAAIDYLIADSWTLPATEEASFTEKIWRLPEIYLCFTPPDEDVPVSAPPALAEGRVTFGCFNSLPKMTDDVVALWARILRAVPGSRLFLKTKQLGDSVVRQSVSARYAAHGIGGDQLILEDGVPGRAEHLATYNRVDIALDPFPYSGITTSAETLWMSVPVLTLAGESFLSRQGVGLLMNTGLPEWIASNPDDYVARAVSHAGDLQSLTALRTSLRNRFLTSPVCDAKRFARHFEQALEAMWKINPSH